jgi:hypothetical protein
MNEEEGDLKEKIKETIKNLLSLSYEGLKEKPRYSGYPTCDYIACILNLKSIDEEEFQKIFNNVVTDYKDNWTGFENIIIKPKLENILEIIYQIKKLKGTADLYNFLLKSKFDLFSDGARICNMSLSSALMAICIYANMNKNWMKENKNRMKEGIELLLATRVSEKGWQYELVEEQEQNVKVTLYAHTLSTRLSLAVLNNIPQEIITGNINIATEIETIKREVIDWLKDKVYEEKEKNYCSWCFRPDEMNNQEYGDNSPNAVATAQAILTLYLAGFDTNNKIIESSIGYIKDNKTSIKNLIQDVIPESKTNQEYPGIQHCLQALLKCEVPKDDESIIYLLNKSIKIIDDIVQKERRLLTDSYFYYNTSVPLSWYLSPFVKPPPRPKIAVQLSDFKNKFEKFVSKANSIVLIGEIDIMYANFIPKNTQVTFFCRIQQEPAFLKNYNWKINPLDAEKSIELENINIVVVDEKKALISSYPFKAISYIKKYILDNSLEGDEIFDYINQLGIKIPINHGRTIKKEILDLIEFPKHREIMEQELETLEPAGLQGILEYFKLIPEITEKTLAPALGLVDRRSVEREFSVKGIFSRVFVNSTLRNLVEQSVDKVYTKFLVLDESSASLLLNTKEPADKKRVIECFSDCLDSIKKLFVTSDIYDELLKFLGRIEKSRSEKIVEIDDVYINKFEKLKRPGQLQFTKNEKTVIGYVAEQRKEDFEQGKKNYGIITNSWEVVKMCKDNEIETFSIMKFLKERGDGNIYKLFRVPIDEFRQE